MSDTIPPPPPAPTASREPVILAVLGFLLAFASISTDFDLPALPTMAQALGSDPGTMALTVSGYLAGFSAGQLL